MVVSPWSSCSRPVSLKTSLSAASAALNAEEDEDPPAVLVAEHGHDDGVEDRVDGEHVETDVGEGAQAVRVDDVVVDQQNQHVQRQQTEHHDNDEHDQQPDDTDTHHHTWEVLDKICLDLAFHGCAHIYVVDHTGPIL